MSTVITHRGTAIITLQPGEDLPMQRNEGDILLVPDGAGWWTHFVGTDGMLESYDAPFESYDKALWTAKAAAEFADAEA